MGRDAHGYHHGMVRPEFPSDELRSAVARSLGTRVVSWSPRRGGFSSAGLWVIETAAGNSFFVKAATTDDTASFLRSEMEIYASIEAPFLPGIETWEDDAHRPFVVMENLSRYHWPPPWDREQIDAVLAVCAQIAATEVPATLQREIDSALRDAYWQRIAADVDSLVESGVGSPQWLEMALPGLIDAESAAVVDGTSLVHADIRSDNLCIIGRGVKVVDWNWAYIGNPELDVVAWLPSLRLEGGPAPWELVTADAGLVARVSGFFLYHSTLPPNPMVRGDLRSLQRAQGEIGLEWASRILGISRPSSSR